MKQLFNTGESIVVLGAEFSQAESSTIIPEHCIVIAEGEEDVLVELKTYETYSLYKNRRKIVPKQRCIKLAGKNADMLFNTKILKPKIGDLVLIQQGGHFDKEHETLTGIVQGVTSSVRSGERLTVFINGEIKNVSIDNVLVLQRYSVKKLNKL